MDTLPGWRFDLAVALGSGGAASKTGEIVGGVGKGLDDFPVHGIEEPVGAVY